MADRTAGSGSVTAAPLPGEIEKILFRIENLGLSALAEDTRLAITTALATARQEQRERVDKALSDLWCELGKDVRWGPAQQAAVSQAQKAAYHAAQPLEGA